MAAAHIRMRHTDDRAIERMKTAFVVVAGLHLAKTRAEALTNVKEAIISPASGRTTNRSAADLEEVIEVLV